MSSLVTIYLYRSFGTDQRAYSAPAAVAALSALSYPVAVGVKLIDQADNTLRAEQDAELAALAKLLAYLDIPFHIDVYCIFKASGYASSLSLPISSGCLLLKGIVLQLAGG